MKIAFPLVAALASASPCFADDLPKLDDTIQMFLESAKLRPDYQNYHSCTSTGKCQTIATSTRDPDPYHRVGRDTFLKPDGKDQITWCFQNVVGADTHSRLCQMSDPNGPYGQQVWTEAYFPALKFWKKIPVAPYLPACASWQMAKHSVDDAYADCVVKQDPEEAKAEQAEAERQAAEQRKIAGARAGIEQDCLSNNDPLSQAWRKIGIQQQICNNAAQSVANPLAVPRRN